MILTNTMMVPSARCHRTFYLGRPQVSLCCDSLALRSPRACGAAGCLAGETSPPALAGRGAAACPSRARAA
jgi:hypothetical protein